METTLQLDSSPTAARAARDEIRALFADTPASPSVLDTVLLLTSELVMNAVQHAQAAAILNARVEKDLVRVAVTDRGLGVPAVEHHEGEFTGRGRGLLIVEQCATRWGVDDAGGGGKTVWFELEYVRPVS